MLGPPSPVPPETPSVALMPLEAGACTRLIRTDSARHLTASALAVPVHLWPCRPPPHRHSELRATASAGEGRPGNGPHHGQGLAEGP